MDNQKLSRAAAAAYETKLEEYSGMDNITGEHRFSRAFEKKIRDSILATEPASEPMIRPGRLSWRLVFAATILFSVGFCLGAAQMPIHDLILRLTGKQSEIILSSETWDGRIGLGRIYTLTAIPEGYQLINSYMDSDHSTSFYSNGTNTFAFSQYRESVYKDVYINSRAESEYITDENGQEYLFLIDTESMSVTWHKDEYVFLIYGTIDKNAALNLCKSAKFK